MIAGLAFLVQALWPAFAAAGAVGFVVGAATCSAGPVQSGGRAAVWLALALVLAGATAAILGSVPGRPGLWLEIAILVGVTYLVACAFGCLVRRGVGNARPRANGRDVSSG